LPSSSMLARRRKTSRSGTRSPTALAIASHRDDCGITNAK
jgi:hypothetical protein